jgi:hypothetical protein
MRLTSKRRAAGLIMAVVAGGGLLAGSATASTAATGTASPAQFPVPVYGVNDDYAGAASFAAVNVGPLLKQLDPETLRYPGGTEADYFDWHTGKPTNGSSSYSFTLTDLYHAYQATGAPPVFDLNVLAAGNRLNTSDQVAMLTAAQNLGLPVTYVEIGNELYGGGATGAFAQAFPTGADYGRTVALYVAALHRDFPGVKVAADAVLNGSTTRAKDWNSQLLATATGAGAPDALILHDYPGVTYNPFTSADVPPLFATAYTAISGLTSAVQSLGGKPVWLTEYNFRGPYVPPAKRKPNPVQNSYARELYVAEWALMLPRIPDLTQADYFTAVAGGTEFGAWSDPGDPTLTPAGQAAEMIDAAARGAASSVAITVPGAPTLPGGDPAVTGQAFTGPGRATTALLVNLTGSAQDVPVSTDVPDGASYQQATGQPTAQQTAAGPLTSGTITGATLRLPAYSITLVNTTTGAA